MTLRLSCLLMFFFKLRYGSPHWDLGLNIKTLALRLNLASQWSKLQIYIAEVNSKQFLVQKKENGIYRLYPYHSSQNFLIKKQWVRLKIAQEELRLIVSTQRKENAPMITLQISRYKFPKKAWYLLVMSCRYFDYLQTLSKIFHWTNMVIYKTTLW